MGDELYLTELKLALVEAEEEERRLREIWLDTHSPTEGPERLAWWAATERRKELFEMFVEEKTRCQ